MKRNFISCQIGVSLLLSFLPKTYANVPKDAGFPLHHCYHWIKENEGRYARLTYKYKAAETERGGLSFYTTTTGNRAGDGLYCGKTPLDSITYGDRVIRIEFVDDVVLQYGVNYCGNTPERAKSANHQECQRKTPDVLLFDGTGQPNGEAWYVIKNPKAIKNWTANNSVLENDLRAVRNSAHISKIDATLAFMKAESPAFKNKTFYNLNARVDFNMENLTTFDQYFEKMKKESPETHQLLQTENQNPLKIAMYGYVGKGLYFMFIAKNAESLKSQCKTFASKNAEKLKAAGATQIGVRLDGARDAITFDNRNNLETTFCIIVVDNATQTQKKLAQLAEASKIVEQARQSIPASDENFIIKDKDISYTLILKDEKQFTPGCHVIAQQLALDKKASVDVEFMGITKTVQIPPKAKTFDNICKQFVSGSAGMKKEAVAQREQLRHETIISSMKNPEAAPTQKYAIRIKSNATKYQIAFDTSDEFYGLCDILVSVEKLNEANSLQIEIGEESRTIEPAAQLSTRAVCDRIVLEHKLVSQRAEFTENKATFQLDPKVVEGEQSEKSSPQEYHFRWVGDVKNNLETCNTLIKFFSKNEIARLSFKNEASESVANIPAADFCSQIVKSYKQKSELKTDSSNPGAQ